MADDMNEEGDDLVELVASLQAQVKQLAGKLVRLERTLRQEGFGEDEDEEFDTD